MDAQDRLLLYVARPVGPLDSVVGRWELVQKNISVNGTGELRVILELRANGTGLHTMILDNVEVVPTETTWTLQNDELTFGDGVNIALTHTRVLPGVALSYQTFERLE